MKKSEPAEKRLDFSKAVRGKYYERMQSGANVVVIAPDLLEVFPDSDSVNAALRKLVPRKPAHKAPASSRPQRAKRVAQA